MESFNRRAFGLTALVAAVGFPFVVRRVLAQETPGLLRSLAAFWDRRVAEVAAREPVLFALPTRDGRPIEISWVRPASHLDAWRVERSSVARGSGTTAWDVIRALPGVVEGSWPGPRGDIRPCVEAICGPAIGLRRRWDQGVVYSLILEVIGYDGQPCLVEVSPRINARLCELTPQVREIRLFSPDDRDQEQGEVVLSIILD